MARVPVAFLSYVRLDDQHENGRLSEFCQRLSGEVRLQTGETFHIFQDRNDIRWGEQWQQRIEESLDAVTFLIPMLTPGFFRSPPCRSEFEHFLNRENQLGRRDLILPVYYVNCPVLNDEARRESDLLAKTIGGRQYADWRELRFEPFTSPQVGKTIARLAEQIVQSLERDAPVKPVVVEAKVSETETGSNAAAIPSKSGEAATEMPVTSRGPAEKTEPRTRVVDALHRGDHLTLTDALSATEPGDRILIRPGLYKEGVVIDKPVEIIGDGELGEVVIEANGKDAILFQANMARIANLTLRQTGGGNWFCIDITQGRLDLEGCDITSQSLACVAIRDGADPRLRRNRIHDGNQGGVYVYANGQGTLEDNDIFANAVAGVEIISGGNPSLRHNRIHHGKQVGVMVGADGHGTLEDNDIFANTFAGVEIKESGNATLRRNRIHDGGGTGAFVHTNGQGILEDNEIFANARAGVEIRGGGNPTLRRNRIRDGKSGGVFVHNDGQGTLEDNDILANAFAGMEIKEGGSPIVRRNRISEHAYQAIWVYDGGRGVFEDNDLRGNTRGAWNISTDCQDKVIRERNKE
jgi:parallel beta-helix repeat protein